MHDYDKTLNSYKLYQKYDVIQGAIPVTVTSKAFQKIRKLLYKKEFFYWNFFSVAWLGVFHVKEYL